MSSANVNPRIAVIGGGITGLAAAHRLHELCPSAEVQLLEACQRLGGVLETVRQEPYLIERSADMFTTNEPWALDLCRRIGFAEELIGPNEQHRRAFVVRKGKLHPVPEGFTLLATAQLGPILRTPLLSPLGKLRMGWELFVRRRRETTDESLAAFAIRRFGKEAYERLIQPLIGGIYTADPFQLSMQATLPRFLELERQHGSLIKALRQQRQTTANIGSGARYGVFVAPKNGMSSFIAALAAKLKPGVVQLNSPVEELTREPSGQWLIRLKNGEIRKFAAVILAAPAYACPPLVRTVDEPLAELIAKIPHAGCSVVVSCYRRSQIRHPLDAFGLVVPHVEGRRIIAASFSSVKFAGRAPDDAVIVRTFIGGALQPELAQLPDDKLKSIAAQELNSLLGVTGTPEISLVVRWLGVMPQYHVGHVQLADKIEAREQTIPGFALAGNAYRGVGIPFCVRSGERAAARIVAELQGT